MAILRILGGNGDTTLTWDPQAVATDDLDAKAAVAEAERIFKENMEKGASAFTRSSPDDTARRIEEFDPNAKEIFVVPAIAGG